MVEQIWNENVIFEQFSLHYNTFSYFSTASEKWEIFFTFKKPYFIGFLNHFFTGQLCMQNSKLQGA